MPCNEILNNVNEYSVLSEIENYCGTKKSETNPIAEKYGGLKDAQDKSVSPQYKKRKRQEDIFASMKTNEKKQKQTSLIQVDKGFSEFFFTFNVN